jgi:RNA polymerase sigma factor (sigma-70 family)
VASGIDMGAVPEQARAVLGQFCSGNEAAFEALFRLHQRTVYGWILRIVRDPGTAEDLTIETFFRIHRAHARFDPGRDFEPWARRIATHAALDWMRAQKPESAMAEEFFAAVPSPQSSDPALTEEIRRTVALALGRLPPKLRVAALLAVIEERPHKEVANALGISTAAVKLRVYRAMRRLRTDLEQQGIRP